MNVLEEELRRFAQSLTTDELLSLLAMLDRRQARRSPPADPPIAIPITTPLSLRRRLALN